MGVEVTSEIESGAVVPAIPDRPQGENELAHPWGRVGPWHGESFLNMGLDLASEPKDEPATAEGLEVVGCCCQRHGYARRRQQWRCQGRPPWWTSLREATGRRGRD